MFRLSPICMTSRLLSREDEEPDSPEVRVRLCWAAYLGAAMVLNTSAVLSGLAGGNQFLLFCASAMLALHSAMLGILLLRKEVTAVWSTAVVVFSVLNLCLADLALQAVHRRATSFFFVTVDLLLVVELPKSHASNTVWVLCAWLVLAQSELTWRFGMLDVPGLPDYEDRQMACAKPPCGDGDVLAWCSRGFAAVACLLIHFRLNKMFVDRAERDRRKVAAAVDTAIGVATSLAEFDLEAAEGCLREAAELPEEVVLSFTALLNNLRTYRPYLPQALLAPAGSRTTVPDRSAVEDFPPRAGREGRPPSSASEAGCTFSDFDNTRSSISESCASETPPSEPSLGGHLSPNNTATTPRAGLRSGGEMGGDLRPSSTEPLRSPMNRQRAPQRAPLSQTGLRLERVSLLKIVCDMDVAPAENPKQYIETHRNCMASVLQAVGAQRGMFDNFQGDEMYASFNAFRRVANHTVAALHTATKLRAAAPPGNIRFAVITTVASVGTLGTFDRLSPTILGEGLSVLQHVSAVGALLRKMMVCNSTAYRNSALSLPLRVLLHQVTATARDDDADGGGDDGGPMSPTMTEVDLDEACTCLNANPPFATFSSPSNNSVGTLRLSEPGVLQGASLSKTGAQAAQSPHLQSEDPALALIVFSYESEGEAPDLEGRTESVGFLEHSSASLLALRDGEEWMYQMEREPGKPYEAYNQAGMIFHRRGHAAAAAYLTTVRASQAVRDAFEHEAARVKHIDLAPRVSADPVAASFP